ncbi:glycosyltransferase family 2 protein [Vibrio genomosp. F6]|uniref:glycosyltransferase family 2 protein n=1 Tax=Vibrio genomosp. F6 TaxID=723172 RepID=UPI0010BCF260|nr:glycosyltransferase family A protein [Vibrio genomosp. F6]TKF23468.1 glycosyltransferase family 2 protein [Vibrio genomosp. F6]
MLTIIIPAFNSERTISRCINSILESDLKTPNILNEIIIVNDGSTDNTLNKLNKIASNNKKIKIINQENKGAGGARNTGIKNSNSEYISFVDVDDTVDDMYLSPLIDCKHDLISFNLIKENKNGSHCLITCNDKNGSIVSAFLKRSYIIDNAIYAPEKINYEDNAICFLIYNKTKNKHHQNSPLYNYKYSKNSQSNTKSYRHAEDRVDSIIYLIDNAKRLDIYNENKSTLDEMAFSVGYLPALSLCFRKWGNYNKLSSLRQKLLSNVEVKLPVNTKLKNKIFYLLIEKFGRLGYLLICFKRINKIFK